MNFKNIIALSYVLILFAYIQIILPEMVLDLNWKDQDKKLFEFYVEIDNCEEGCEDNCIEYNLLDKNKIEDKSLETKLPTRFINWIKASLFDNYNFLKPEMHTKSTEPIDMNIFHNFISAKYTQDDKVLISLPSKSESYLKIIYQEKEFTLRIKNAGKYSILSTHIPYILVASSYDFKSEPRAWCLYAKP